MTQWLNYDLTDSPAQQTGEKKKKCKKHELVSAIEIGIGWMIMMIMILVVKHKTCCLIITEHFWGVIMQQFNTSYLTEQLLYPQM